MRSRLPPHLAARLALAAAATAFLVSGAAGRASAGAAGAAGAGSPSRGGSEGLRARLDPERGTPRFVEVVSPSRRKGTDAEVARSFVADHRDALGLTGGGDVAAVGEERDSLGQRHVRLEQRYKGIPVVGSGLVVHLGPAGPAGSEVRSANGRLYRGINLAQRPVLSRDWAAGF
ncbi:MAG TPA: hypothetical protein VKI64_03090, partial [Acidimicrobiales bacterium]|nr:hypothetical protein [Acidimicrobiales bacterium]